MERERQGNKYVPSLSDFRPDPLSPAPEKIIAKSMKGCEVYFCMTFALESPL